MPDTSTATGGLARMFHWQRIVTVLVIASLLGYMVSGGWKGGPWPVVLRANVVGFVALVLFGILEQLPHALPGWLPRWVLQVGAVALCVPVTLLVIYVSSTEPGAPPFYRVQDRLFGFGILLMLGMMVVPATAFTALVRQKELERGELERSAQDARMQLLQAQVTPHFLFNTLANVQALVDAGSPQASAVLRSLTAYLRAAVPRLGETGSTVAQELQLVDAYLKLMHMRMPDRLKYSITADEAARPLYCPPLAIQTLVENAVRHGIDPAEEGGQIDVQVRREGERCIVRVTDTGVGLQPAATSQGTGLANLRERLQLAFGRDAQLRLTTHETQGVCAEVVFPARESRT